MFEYLILFLFFGLSQEDHSELPKTCGSPVYCYGSLLRTIQFSRIFNDCKKFVDLKMKYNVDTTLHNFDKLMNVTNNHPTQGEVKNFVAENFEEEDELMQWIPLDYNPHPSFLDEISNTDIRKFAEAIISLWPSLARQVKAEVKLMPDQYSFIPVPNGFIIPGGRFRELYYWDSYWIIDGLLVSEMTETARGMLDNFISIIQRFGFVPTGTRIYYLERSHPPLLVAMVYNYYKHTEDLDWIEDNIHHLEEEQMYWLEKRTRKVNKNNVEYTLATYNSHSLGPRPESYREDVQVASYFKDARLQQEVYNDLKAAAESGWDFSSRWIFDHSDEIRTNLSYTQTRRVIPVDLNAMLFMNFKLLSKLFFAVGKYQKSIEWHTKAKEWQNAIENILWDENDGIWYDYDLKKSEHRKKFFLSNLTPLWTKTFDRKQGIKFGNLAVKYLMNHKILDFLGGVPVSLRNSGEQWDFPNAWPPYQAILVHGLENTGSFIARREAKKLARRWIATNMRGYRKHDVIYEKYNAMRPGKHGSGGEYVVQSGFGWTNGIILRFIKTYYTKPFIRLK